ncbi:MAG: ABC transporter permease [Tissierellia bacterium]|nr:ABC transporter permease [Tissierellia bacterium]
MDILETIKLSLEGLRQNKMRSFLTMLGIIIGISSVIAITTVGYAMTKSVNKAFDSVGRNTAQISMVQRNDNVSWDDFKPEYNITKTMIDDIKESFSSSINSITIYGPGGSAEIREGKKTVQVSISSTTEGEEEVNKIKMIAGRFLMEKDITRGKPVAIISDIVLKDIFGGDVNKALGSEIKTYRGNNLQVYTVVGIYEHQVVSVGTFGKSSETSNLYIPVSYGERVYSQNKQNSSGEKYYDWVVLSMKNPDTMEKDIEQISSYLDTKYYSKNKDFKPDVTTSQAQLEEINAAMSNMKLAVSVIAGISLLVGGIGVMNILLVSVTERTREIGIRKALGARKNDIRKQFIIESIIICVIGGIFGIILGALMGFAGSKLLEMPTGPSPTSIIVAVGFSMFIGMFFGYYPANKAAKLDPIEALRYE